MANHNLLLDLLEQYGAPPRFVSAIKQIYQDLVVVLKIEKKVVELTQSAEVRQGDNMAPVLFLFLMSAFAETLKTEWKNAGIGVNTVQSVMGEKLLADTVIICLVMNRTKVLMYHEMALLVRLTKVRR
jgi:hypothetical protein